jgi:hypothetical protein
VIDLCREQLPALDAIGPHQYVACHRAGELTRPVLTAL